MTISKTLRKDFPIFSRKLNGKRLSYLDSAATSQKPKVVIDAMDEYYSQHNANPGRGVSTLTAESEEAYERARKKVAEFVGAKSEEIVFVRNTTEALNLLSYVLPSALSTDLARPVALTKMEHHSNLVPWQQMAKRTDRKLAFVPFDTNKPISTDQLASLSKTNAPALLTMAQASNVLGTIQDIRAAGSFAHEEWNCPIVVDAAQSAPHMKIDVKKLDCDFLAFSAHKMLGPMGIGALYMRGDWMERLPPFLTGGGQIGTVQDTTSTWADGPSKFEAGTPDVGAAVGWEAAISNIERIGLANIESHERKLTKKTLDMLANIEGVTTYGIPTAQGRVGVIPFNLKNVHPHDLGTILDQNGVQVRVGHHCAQPLMRVLGVNATARASFYLYNDIDDIEALESGIKAAKKVFV